MKQITVKDIYKSRLTKKLVKKDAETLKWVKMENPAPVGVPEIDLLAQALMQTPVLSNKQLVERTGVEASRLYKQVAYWTGMTFSVFISKYRMAVAEELLRCTNLSLMEIIHLTGVSRITFHRNFKQFYNETPQVYRDLNRPEGYPFFYRHAIGRQKNSPKTS